MSGKQTPRTIFTASGQMTGSRIEPEWARCDDCERDVRAAQVSECDDGRKVCRPCRRSGVNQLDRIWEGRG